MREFLKNKLSKYDNRMAKYNYLREYFQLLILRIIDEKGFFQKLAFIGGTALRILYDLNRFSEDLDFCLIDNKNFSFETLLQSIERELTLANFSVSIVGKDKKTVAAAFIKFKNLLYEFDLSSHEDQNLSIKLEIDQNPPAGYQTAFSMINKEFLVGINHYDLPSLYASKLHAILHRKYEKGRDYYDLIWYISKNIVPNYALLNVAIQQTEHRPSTLDEKSLNQALRDRIERTDFDRLRLDTQPFLADPGELRFFTKAYFLKLIDI